MRSSPDELLPPSVRAEAEGTGFGADFAGGRFFGIITSSPMFDC